VVEDSRILYNGKKKVKLEIKGEKEIKTIP
jgi:hypothetical protein